ncbi:vWA domain-containing protein [Saccharothrix syringae]|uniref:VWA domain-containing protein n=1 Tax=Saccharothrix syringae TaxID=103733 RepID=A0A5Q0H054_SACSY|nr:vWA domain-containing protein [Saccharothrix syringae]QFZ19631.1 VWA domain-containing protein [Saccharothrix syringae]
MSTFGPAGRWSARVALVAALLAGAATTAPARAQEPPPQLQPVRIVVLVDQSGSLTDEDVAAERDAVRVIVQGEPSPGSTVSVVGFASADRSEQSAVDVVCPPTALDTPQRRQVLADCVGGLRRRTEAEGDGTDHVAALNTALGYLDAPGATDQRKIVYLLTDGELDVSDSPAYGPGPGADRNAAALDQVPGLLDRLAAAGVAVWPLGFGKANPDLLARFATGGAQDRCGVRTPAPGATVVTGSADLLRTIGDASRRARCASVGDPVTGELPDGGSLDLRVDVPAIASAGSILVYKRDPRVVVGYLDPNGDQVPVNGGSGVSRFELSGQGTETEALRIVNPEPGTWTVRLSAPPGVPTRNVGTVAIFQGAVRAVIGLDPPAPEAGATVEVTMQVRGSRGAITDPDQLRGLTLTAELSGDGFPPVPAVELADAAGDGQYRGALTVPSSATGRLDFLGSVTGVGVSGDRRPYPTRVSAGAAGLTGVLTLAGEDDEVVPGESLAGRADVTNATGEARALRLELVDPSAGAVISAEPALLQVPAAGNAVLDFSVRFDPATTLGPNQARLRLVDEADGAVVAELLFARDLVPVPTLFERLWWLWALLAVAVAAAAAVVLRRVRRARAERDVRGVRVELRRHGQTVQSMRAQHRGDEFRFAVRQGPGAEVGLTTGGGAARYAVRRDRGGATLRGPSGAPVALGPGGVLDLGDGVELVLHDRPAAGTAPRPRRREDPYAASGSGRRSSRPEDPYDNT